MTGLSGPQSVLNLSTSPGDLRYLSICRLWGATLAGLTSGGQGVWNPLTFVAALYCLGTTGDFSIIPGDHNPAHQYTEYKIL